MRLRRHGLGIDAPPGWDVRISRRPGGGERSAAAVRARSAAPDLPEEMTTNPVVHLATIPLPEERGDFGGAVTPYLGDDDVFVSLFEYDREACDTALFARRGLPNVTPADFDPSQLQRTLEGQSGRQYFFQHEGRAFCLYVVLGAHARRALLVPRVRAALATLEVEPGGSS